MKRNSPFNALNALESVKGNAVEQQVSARQAEIRAAVGSVVEVAKARIPEMFVPEVPLVAPVQNENVYSAATAAEVDQLAALRLREKVNILADATAVLSRKGFDAPIGQGNPVIPQNISSMQRPIANVQYGSPAQQSEGAQGQYV